MLRLVAKGLSYKQIAERLVLSHRTVQNHVQNTLGKLQLHNRVELTRYAIEQGLDDYGPGTDRGQSHRAASGLVDGQLLGARAAAGRARVVRHVVGLLVGARRPRPVRPAGPPGASATVPS